MMYYIERKTENGEWKRVPDLDFEGWKEGIAGLEQYLVDHDNARLRRREPTTKRLHVILDEETLNDLERFSENKSKAIRDAVRIAVQAITQST